MRVLRAHLHGEYGLSGERRIRCRFVRVGTVLLEVFQQHIVNGFLADDFVCHVDTHEQAGVVRTDRRHDARPDDQSVSDV